MRRVLLLLVVGLLALVSAVASSGGATQAQARWVIIDLGTLGGGYGQAVAINERGQVVGSAYTQADKSGNRVLHAFLWEKGKIRDLGTLGGKESSASDINDRGQVVGVAETRLKSQGYTIRHGFLWQNGKMRDLGRFLPEAVNNRGQVVGYFYAKSGRTHAFLWEDGKARDLGTFGGRSSMALAINERGQVVGWWDEKGTKKTDYFPSDHAFLWENGRMRDLGTLGKFLGSVRSRATDINERGQVVGWSDAREWHPFLWQNGRMRDLGVLGQPMTEGEAHGINERGQVVGVCYSEADEHGDHWYNRAFLWENGRMIALPRLSGADQPEPKDQAESYDINNQGQIVGWSTTKSDDLHPVLWTLKR